MWEHFSYPLAMGNSSRYYLFSLYFYLIYCSAVFLIFPVKYNHVCATGKPFGGDKKLHIQEAIKQRFNLKSINGMKRLGKVVFTLLIIRDPIERLISSFKSKIACNSTYYRTDYYDRHVLVPQLLNLRGKKDQLYTDVMQSKYEERCLSFYQYLVVLKDIHSIPSKKSRLNQHFLPQDLECLGDGNRRDINISKSWKAVGSISNTTIYQQFFDHLLLHGLEPKGGIEFVKPKKTHSSKGTLQPTRE